jgi:hypothetical protein
MGMPIAKSVTPNKAITELILSASIALCTLGENLCTRKTRSNPKKIKANMM